MVVANADDPAARTFWRPSDICPKQRGRAVYLHSVLAYFQTRFARDRVLLLSFIERKTGTLAITLSNSKD